MKTFLGANVRVRRDRIRCPQCGTAQVGEVWIPDPPSANLPFPLYSHFCCVCDYLILESEWDADPAEPAAGPDRQPAAGDGHPD